MTKPDILMAQKILLNLAENCNTDSEKAMQMKKALVEAYEAVSRAIFVALESGLS